MSQAVPATHSFSDRLRGVCRANASTGLFTLKVGTVSWFAATVLGQWTFLAYTVIAYGLTAFAGDFVSWNERIESGHLPGDAFGNAMVGVHLLTAVLVLGLGPLQLIPWVRTRWPRLHGWSGKAFILGSAIAVLAGLYMLFDRDIGSFSLQAGFVSQAVLMGAFGWLTYRTAVRRDLAAHHSWALRFYMVTNIALFYRVIFVLWFMVTGGVGVNIETGEGAFLDFMALGQYLPLFLLEVYLRIRQSGSRRMRIGFTWVLFISAIATVIGTLALAAGMWFTSPS